MEAIGAVATIVGLVQAGLSLAKALNNYAGTVHDSNDDIAVIADDIYATYRHLNDLQLVLKQNEKATILTPDALESAEKVVRQAEILIQKLKKLLIKGHGSDNAREIVQSEQIDIGKFRKGIWYIYKSEFELRRSELAQIKADISLIYLTYLALSAGTTTERKQAQEEMELVYNRKVVLNKNVKKAREKRDRDAERDIADDGGLPVEDGDGVYEYPAELEDTAIVYDDIEALYREFDTWLAKKEQKTASQAAERKKLEEEAVMKHEEELKERARKMEVEARKLHDVLLTHGVAPQRISEITQDIYPRIEGSVTARDGAPVLAKDPMALVHSDGKADIGSLLDPLRDLNEPGGIAQLKAFYLQRVYMSPTRSEITKLEVAVSGQHLLSRGQVVRGKISSEAELNDLGDFGEIPEDYIIQIRQELATLWEDQMETWILLHAEPVKSRAEKGRFRFRKSKKSGEEVVGVRIVIRKIARANERPRPEEVTTRAETVGLHTQQSTPEVSYRSTRSRGRERSPEITIENPSFSRRSREGADYEYLPRHASRLIPRQQSIHLPVELEASLGAQKPIQRKRPTIYESSDSSPERGRSQRRTRFAPQVINIPSPHYQDSASEAGRTEYSSRMSEYSRSDAVPRVEIRHQAHRGRYRYDSVSPVSTWDGENSPMSPLRRRSSAGYVGPEISRHIPRRRDSISPDDSDYIPYIGRHNRTRPTPYRMGSYARSGQSSRIDLATMSDYRSEAGSRPRRRSRDAIALSARPQSSAGTYSIHHVGTRRTPTGQYRIVRPGIQRSRSSMEASATEDDIVPKTETDLPPGAAVQSILNQWGCNRDPMKESHEEDTEDYVPGPLSRRSTFDPDEVHRTNGL